MIPDRWRAIFFTLLACAMSTTVVAISRIVSETTPISTVLFFQYFISMMVLLPCMFQQGRRSLYLSKVKMIFIRSISGFLNYALIFFAVQKTPLVNVVLLNNASPIFLPLIILVWKKVQISRKLWIGIIVGFFGIAIILRPTNFLINLGSLLALCSAICISISMISQRRLVKSESIYTISFYYFLISSIISFPFMLERWVPLDQKTMILLGSIGLLFVAGQYFLLKAFKHEKPTYLGSFSYSSIVYSVLLEWLIWKQFPGWVSLAGIVVVCTGGLITIHQGARKGILAWRGKKIEENKNPTSTFNAPEEDRSSN